MKKSRFSESQVVAILLKEAEVGAKVGKTCRKHAISDPHLLQVEERVPVRATGRHSNLTQHRNLQERLFVECGQRTQRPLPVADPSPHFQRMVLARTLVRAQACVQQTPALQMHVTVGHLTGNP